MAQAREDVLRYQPWKRGEIASDAYLAEDRPRYNIAPTQQVLIVRKEQGQKTRRFRTMRWGLIPSWATDPSIGNRTLNARSETVQTKAAFRESILRRRCLIPADGFFEWRKMGTVKQPYCFEVGEGDVFALAGLWDEWRSPEGEIIGLYMQSVPKSCEVVLPESGPPASRAPQVSSIMSPMDDSTRDVVANSLEQLAEQATWNPELWQRCYDLVSANSDHELLKYVHDDVIHYSGVFHERSIFGFRVKPDRYELEHYRQEFRDVAAALRSSMSLAEARQKYEL